MRERSRLKVAVLGMLCMAVFLLSACTSALKPVAKPIENVENPIEAIRALENEIANGRQNQLNVLSPDGFAKAEAAYLEAKKGVEKKTEISDIIENVAVARKHLQHSEETAKIATTMLPQVIESRHMARTAGATKLEKEYAGVEKQFLELTRAIEKNNIHYTQKNASKVNDAYRDLELRAIKVETIGEVRSIIKQAEKEEAKKYVPQSFAIAKNGLDDTNAYISNNPYAKEKMYKMAQENLFMARRVLSLTDQSKKLAKMQPEETALWMEDILNQIVTPLSAQDMRDQKFNTQIDNIIGSIKSLQNDDRFMAEKLKSSRNEIEGIKTSYQANIDDLNQRIAFLEGKTQEEQSAKERLALEQRTTEQRLAAERKFNKLFTEVQEYFNAGEAEVYRQGNQLVIRLKAIQFPIAQSIIMPENYLLLSKVQRAIRTFSEPSVIIEGHTDSTGTDEFNQHLSQQRAKAVRDYLVANQTLPVDKIIAAGYGSERPLASNETPEGRAINRRIDIVVIPASQLEQ